MTMKMREQDQLVIKVLIKTAMMHKRDMYVTQFKEFHAFSRAQSRAYIAAAKMVATAAKLYIDEPCVKCAKKRA